jgi:Ca2+-binding EF-hand superfamily protein
MLMLTKLKIALVVAGSLITGVAAAQGTGTAAPTKAEWKAKHAAMKQEMLKKFDTNRDGKLDDRERAAARETRMLEHFKKLDTDGNGVLSLAEFKAGKQGHMGKRHARGGRGMHRGFRGGNGSGVK